MKEKKSLIRGESLKGSIYPFFFLSSFFLKDASSSGKQYVKWKPELAMYDDLEDVYRWSSNLS